MVGAHAFTPSTGVGRSVKFEVSLVYRGTSQTAKATQRNIISKNKTKKNLYVSVYVPPHMCGGQNDSLLPLRGP